MRLRVHRSICHPSGSSFANLIKESHASEHKNARDWAINYARVSHFLFSTLFFPTSNRMIDREAISRITGLRSLSFPPCLFLAFHPFSPFFRARNHRKHLPLQYPFSRTGIMLPRGSSVLLLTPRTEKPSF